MWSILTMVDQYGQIPYVYEMFMGPLDASIAWSENGLGIYSSLPWTNLAPLCGRRRCSLSERIQDAENPSRTCLPSNCQEGNGRLRNSHFNTAISQWWFSSRNERPGHHSKSLCPRFDSIVGAIGSTYLWGNLAKARVTKTVASGQAYALTIKIR